METRTFKAAALVQLGPLVFGLLLGLGTLWRYGTHHVNGYLGIALAIISIVVGGANLIVPPTLKLDAQGWTWRSWIYSATFRWSDIDSFFVGPTIAWGKPKIAFNFLPGKISTQVRTTQLNRRLNGFDRSMANVWNVPTADLVALLNRYLQASKR